MSLHNVMSSKSGNFSWGGGESSQALNEDSAFSKNTPLHLIKRRNAFDPRRPMVEATLIQRVAFYQYMVNSPSKTQFHGSKPNALEYWMLLAVCANLTLGALGSYFIQVFLGVYATEQHLHLSKMVPFAVGINVVYFFSAILELSRFTDLSVAFLDSFVLGVYNRAPWNRCNAFDIPSHSKVINDKTVELECLNIDHFRDAVLSNYSQLELLAFGDHTCYKFRNIDNCIQLPQILFMEHRSNYLYHSKLTLAVYFCILWGGCLLASKQIYRKFIWKVFLYADIALCAFYLVAVLHTSFFPELTPAAYDPDNLSEDLKPPFWELVELMSACFVFSPPLVHFLSARCKKVRPAQESVAMTFSTVVHTMFYTLANYMVFDYANTRMGGLDLDSLFISTYSYMNVFYWYIYFGTLATGNFFGLVFLIINFMIEYTSMIITFNCFVEIYSSEFKWSKRWLVTIAITICSCVNYAIFTQERYFIQFAVRMFILLLEVIAIHLMYPLRRLIDDITFYFGEAPSKMRHFTIITSVIIEIFLLISVVSYDGYDMIGSSMDIQIKETVIYIVLMSITLLPMIAGCVFICIKYTIIDQKDWTFVFVPVEGWGPSNFYSRQLRKEFDSSKFTHFHASRVLSRYLMKNAEPDTYRLDIVYDFNSLSRASRSSKSLFHNHHHTSFYEA